MKQIDKNFMAFLGNCNGTKVEWYTVSFVHWVKAMLKVNSVSSIVTSVSRKYHRVMQAVTVRKWLLEAVKGMVLYSVRRKFSKYVRQLLYVDTFYSIQYTYCET